MLHCISQSCGTVCLSGAVRCRIGAVGRSCPGRADGHRRNASPPHTWDAANNVASQCHRMWKRGRERHLAWGYGSLSKERALAGAHSLWGWQRTILWLILPARMRESSSSFFYFVRCENHIGIWPSASKNSHAGFRSGRALKLED